MSWREIKLEYQKDKSTIRTIEFLIQNQLIL